MRRPPRLASPRNHRPAVPSDFRDRLRRGYRPASDFADEDDPMQRGRRSSSASAITQAHSLSASILTEQDGAVLLLRNDLKDSDLDRDHDRSNGESRRANEDCKAVA